MIQDLTSVLRMNVTQTEKAVSKKDCNNNNNNNNNNNHDNVYGAVIMAEPLREFTQFM